MHLLYVFGRIKTKAGEIMKKIIPLILVLILTVTCSAAGVLKLADPSATPDCTVASGYPRFAMRADGTLIMTTDSNSILFSTDKGATWTKAGREPTAAAASKKITESGTEHKLTRANLQPFVLPDGTVLLAYRSHTSGYTSGEFYSSIRVLTSDNGGKRFSNEKILTEQVADASRGFWEPFMIQIDSDTVALYYADDLNVSEKSQQRIAYFTYTISTGEWSKEPSVAIYRENMKSRDGMPTVTALKDGSFAMVVEVQDYAKWNSPGTNTVFTVGLSLSADGRTWTDPIPVVGPDDIFEGIRCSAPSIATLPDGRVIITYQTDAGYSGMYGTSDYVRVFGAAISDSALTLDTKLSITQGGAAKGFTLLNGLFASKPEGYQIWNTVSCFGTDVYFAGTAGINAPDNSRSGQHIRLRRAEFTAIGGDIDFDGDTDVDDVNLAAEFLANDGGSADIDGNGVFNLFDLLTLIQKTRG